MGELHPCFHYIFPLLRPRSLGTLRVSAIDTPTDETPLRRFNQKSRKISAMKTMLSAFFLRVTLLFAAFAIVSVATSTAQSAGRRSRPVMLPAFIVMEERLASPELDLDGSLTLPDGTVVTQPTRNPDGSITLLDGTVLLPPVHQADGTVTFPDGFAIHPSENSEPRRQSPPNRS